MLEGFLDEALLYRTSDHDLAAFTIAPLVLLTVALVAGWMPARRASRVDPVRSLTGS